MCSGFNYQLEGKNTAGHEHALFWQKSLHRFLVAV